MAMLRSPEHPKQQPQHQTIADQEGTEIPSATSEPGQRLRSISEAQSHARRNLNCSPRDVQIQRRAAQLSPVMFSRCVPATFRLARALSAKRLRDHGHVRWLPRALRRSNPASALDIVGP